MLIVPESVPGSTLSGADPAASVPSVGRVGRTAMSANPLVTGDAAGASGGAAVSPVGESDERFDHTMIRRALTELHARGDRFEQSAREVTGPEVGDIADMTARFLQDQRTELAAGLTNNRQKHMFERGFDVYAQTAMARSQSLREEKLRQFQDEVP
ncbi:MAG: hypothetical protein LIP77_04175, partial [Planctomycetes bacterium]|nr:hypothetical protein [Planctomycetota bacterium]